MNAESSNMWADKIKAELKEIKKTLHIIEKEFFKKKSSPLIEDTKLKAEESGHGIAVFSSRTFILRADNFYLIEESDSEAISEDIGSFFQNDELYYAETERGHFFVSPHGSWLHLKNEEEKRT